MRSIWSFAPKVNLAAPGAIGGTTAGSGAFTTLTASSTLAVTLGTTLTGGLNLPGGSYLLSTTSGLTNGSGGFSGTLTNAPDQGNPSKWIAINDNGTSRYIPTWEGFVP